MGNMNILNIYREFADDFAKIIFHKLVQSHFPKVFCGFSNFLKIAQKLTKNFPKNNHPQVLSKHFAEF